MEDAIARESDGLGCVWDRTDLRNYTVMANKSGREVILCEKGVFCRGEGVNSCR